MGTKYVIAFSLAALLVFTPVVRVQAAALSEAQIQAILGLLSSFGADQGVVGNVNSALRGLPSTSTGTTPVANATAICTEVRTLAAGLKEGATDATTGGIVSKLQRLLAADRSLYPEGLITGYFGGLSVSAVARCAGLTPGGSSSVTPPTSAVKAPSCTWKVNKVNIQPNEEFVLSWTSQNATTASGSDGAVLETEGEKVLAPAAVGPYQYAVTFVGPGGRVTCAATVTVAGDAPATTAAPAHKGSGAIATDTLPPSGGALSGTIADFGEVVVYIYSANGNIFTNGKVIAADGTWVFKPAIPFTPGGTYTVYLYGYPGNVLLEKKTVSVTGGIGL